mmetsp:Transcript_6451/g.12509  ORF Transcript_6451/g.12509 Transcript_6451/m.12509 type:complete len:97 (+) Transcript_6451:470-760(+)
MAADGGTVGLLSQTFFVRGRLLGLVAWPLVLLVACACSCRCPWCVPSKGNAVLDQINKKAKDKMRELEEQPGTWEKLFIAKDIGMYIVDVGVMDSI